MEASLKSDGSLAGIDWQRPWLAHLRERGESLHAIHDWRRAASLAAAREGLQTADGLAVNFRPQEDLPAGTPYEAHIHASGEVPTRDNLHDFFNALAWFHFAQIKRTLNALQTAEIVRMECEGAGHGSRGRQRDAATLFDENAALFFCSDPALAEALRTHRWMDLLLDRRADYQRSWEVMLFGHALLEQLVRPFKSITAHVWVTVVEPEWFDMSQSQRLAAADARLAQRLAHGFTSRDFTHLPVLGVPGWWPGQDRAFYEDVSVFRPPRSKSLAQADNDGG